jgi:hypothetical protein
VLAVNRALLAFGTLLSGAALAYPGGSYDERGEDGFSFWRNFWCDLLSTQAINGAPNLLGSVLARIAFACFAFALYHFWSRAAEVAGMERAARVARSLGRVGAVALLAVAAVPSTTSELLHGIAVLVCAGAQVLAVSVLLWPLWRRGEQLGALLASATLAVSLLCLAQYVRQGCFDSTAAGWLAGMQKIATLCLLAFMLRLSLRSSLAPSVTT